MYQHSLVSSNELIMQFGLLKEFLKLTFESFALRQSKLSVCLSAVSQSVCLPAFLSFVLFYLSVSIGMARIENLLGCFEHCRKTHVDFL